MGKIYESIIIRVLLGHVNECLVYARHVSSLYVPTCSEVSYSFKITHVLLWDTTLGDWSPVKKKNKIQFPRSLQCKAELGW